MSWRRRLSTLICLTICTTIPAFAQLSTGSIAGTVKDSSGAVIPGVTVSLSNPGVIGGNQQVITNERGTYQFTRLVPGNYSVKAELTGFRPSALDKLNVTADFTVRADLTLEVGSVADTVTITGESPLLDTSSALNQAVLDRATLDNLPTGHDLWSIGRTVPNIAVSGTYDVGGNQSFQQYTPTVHGSNGGDNKYAIDGLDVAWAGGAGTVMVYFDPNMFEEVNYQTGNIGAESRQGGVVINMVTKTGTNKFHGSFMFTGTNGPMQRNNLSPELTAQLKQQIPAKVLAANPNIVPGQQINSLFDTAASLSGPVVKDKLWFTATYKISSLNQYLLGNYNPNGTQGLDDNRITNWTLKGSYQLSHASQLHYTYSRNLKYRYHRRTTTYQEDAASRFQDQWADIHQLKWTDTISSKLIADAGVSLQVGPSPYLAKADAESAAAIGLFPKSDTATGASTVMNQNYNTQPQYRISSNFNLSYFAGPHEIKVGYQFGRLMLRSETWSLVDSAKGPLYPYNGPFLARYNNGKPQDVQLFNYPTDSQVFAQEHGFFVQDKWTITRKLTLNPGIRFDAVSAWIPRLCQPTTAYINGQCFDSVQDPAIPNLFNMAPRFSFVYDIFGDGRTAIKGSANIYHIGIDSTYPSRVNPYSTATDTVPWTDTNNDGIPQPGEIAFNFATKTGGPGFSFGNTNVYDRNLKRPYSAEASVGLQRELPGDFVVSASFVRRDVWRTIGSVNTALSPASYDPVKLTFKENGQNLTVYNIKPELQTLTSCKGVGQCILWGNHSDRGSYFNGLDLTVNKRMSNRWELMGGLSLGSNQSRIPYYPDNPNSNLFLGGPTSINVPVLLKASWVYQAPLGFQVAGNMQSFSGTPEQTTYQITRSLVPSLTLTSLTVPLSQRGATSLPTVRMLDLALGRQFRVGEGKVLLQPKMELFNLNNSSAALRRSVLLSGTGSSAYLNPSQVLSPTMLRLTLQTNF